VAAFAVGVAQDDSVLGSLLSNDPIDQKAGARKPPAFLLERHRAQPDGAQWQASFAVNGAQHRVTATARFLRYFQPEVIG
jgi:hypothetical protein